MGFSTGGGGGRAPLGEINVTPLVDVMLVLLIIFMVSAPMMKTGLEVDLPRARAAQMDRDDEKLLVTVTKERKVYLGENEVAIERLKDVVMHNARIQEEKELYIQGDADVPYGFVVQVFGLLREAGVQKIGIVTNPLGSQ